MRPTPLWNNLLEGQINLRDAIRRTIAYSDPGTGKHYKLAEKPAVLFVRPRGWHLEEQHVIVDGQIMSGSIFDFSIYFFHNAKELLARGSGPYFYLPKLENHLEARLWRDIFAQAESELGIAPGSIKATVLIETILAAFEMDEILYELRDYSAGLNCGAGTTSFHSSKSWPETIPLLLPDRSQVTMTTHFLRSYSRLCIETCHKRSVSAMGGMSALIPIKNDPVANEKALAGVRADKEREASDGHDGTWVAHPGLVPVAMEVFDRLMPQSNQINKPLTGFRPTAADLLQAPTGTITEVGLQQNISVCLGYLEAWFRGIGCVPLFNLMEDAATAEISRAQLWQWVHHGAAIENGTRITEDVCNKLLDQELAQAKQSVDPMRYQVYEQAASLMRSLIHAPRFVDFLTLPAYQQIVETEGITA